MRAMMAAMSKMMKPVMSAFRPSRAQSLTAGAKTVTSGVRSPISTPASSAKAPVRTSAATAKQDMRPVAKPGQAAPLNGNSPSVFEMLQASYQNASMAMQQQQSLKLNLQQARRREEEPDNDGDMFAGIATAMVNSSKGPKPPQPS